MSLSEDEAAAIVEIHEQDVAEVRALLQEAIRAAGARWLPMNAIADALIREIVILRGRAPCAFAPREQSHTTVVCHVVRRDECQELPHARTPSTLQGGRRDRRDD